MSAYFKDKYADWKKTKIKVKELERMSKIEKVLKISGSAKVLYVLEVVGQEMRLLDINEVTGIPTASIPKILNHLIEKGLVIGNDKIAEEGPRKERTTFYKITTEGKNFVFATLRINP